MDWSNKIASEKICRRRLCKIDENGDEKQQMMSKARFDRRSNPAPPNLTSTSEPHSPTLLQQKSTTPHSILSMVDLGKDKPPIEMSSFTTERLAFSNLRC